MRKKNVLFYLIDGLRYDIIADPAQRAAFTPNIDGLVKEGFNLRVIANAGATQFVLPALFSQTYPLDYGGYNFGIRHRPKSYVELIRNQGYATYLASTCDIHGWDMGYERGFEEIRGFYPTARIIHRMIERQLKYELDLAERGGGDVAATEAYVREEFDRLLARLQRQCEAYPESVWTRQYSRRNRRMAPQIAAERELLQHEPQTVIRKIRTLPAYYYWTSLGRRRPDWRLRVRQQFERIYYRLFRRVFPTGLMPAHLGLQQVPTVALTSKLPSFLDRAPRPWFVHLHTMDVHSFQVTNGFLYQLIKCRLLRRCLRARKALDKTQRPLLHDLTLMEADAQLGRLLELLRRRGELDDTIVIVTGDHGQCLEEARSTRSEDIGFRSLNCHLETTLVVAGTARRPAEDVLLDSMSVSATLLDILGIDSDTSFQGVSAYDGGLRVAISENAGRGNCDLANRDLYFALTTKTHKLMTVLTEDKLEVRALFDHRSDWAESKDLKDDPANQEIIDELLGELFEKRGDLLHYRNVQPSEIGFGRA